MAALHGGKYEDASLEAVAQRIAQSRNGRFSQEHLSQEAGLSLGYIGLLERGRSSPAIDQLGAIARVLDVDGMWLVTGNRIAG